MLIERAFFHKRMQVSKGKSKQTQLGKKESDEINVRNREEQRTNGDIYEKIVAVIE